MDFLIKVILPSLFFVILFPTILIADTSDVNVNVVLYQCYDGIDNDSDGYIDYPDDPGCTVSNDNNETDPISCGDGTCNGAETCSSCSVDCGACVVSGGGGGGGGGGIIPSIPTIVSSGKVVFKGFAYPNDDIIVLKDAEIVVTTKASPDASFEVSVDNILSGTYIFSLYGEDFEGRRSALSTFPISVTSGATTYVSGIFISPTIDIDKSEVKRGDNLNIFGKTTPESEVTILVHSDEEIFAKIESNEEGIYFYQLDTSPLSMGLHVTKSKSLLGGRISSFSKALSFVVGTQNIEKIEDIVFKNDPNLDGKINIVDFSILAYWYKRPTPPEEIDLNFDGEVNLVDFSILAYHWTG